MAPSLLIYSSYGYSGNLIAEQAIERGLRPILAGRDENKLRAQGKVLDLQYNAFSLEEKAALEAALDEVEVVLHCAGPFRHTYQAMVEACLRTNTHYLDIAGELPVLESIALRDQDAHSAGVMLLPAVGFDVVASDCLVAHLKNRLPSASHLVLAIQSIGSRPSHGTALTAIEFLKDSGFIRRDGTLIPEPIGQRRLQVDFGSGPMEVVSVPWADLCTAYHSTGIANIETYHTFAGSMRRTLTASQYLGWFFSSQAVRSLMKRAILAGPSGPTTEILGRGRSHLWAQVTNAQGEAATARLHTPAGYKFTAIGAIAIVEKVLHGELRPGFQTPATAYGPDFVMEVDDVQREDL
ncbi:MAG: saccharopine dehydrogenase NADP-binding domain-containing protein [Anaerolineales bacterium]|jgi:short subunit dehydrogenase-like uncharacterized protein